MNRPGYRSDEYKTAASFYVECDDVEASRPDEWHNDSLVLVAAEHDFGERVPALISEKFF